MPRPARYVLPPVHICVRRDCPHHVDERTGKTATRRHGCQGSVKFLGESNQKPFGPPDVAEPVHVFVPDHLVDELRAVRAEPVERVVEVIHREHYAQVAKRVDRSGPVIRDHRRSEESRELKPAMAVRRPHHGDLDTLLAESGNPARPLPLRHRLTFELQAEGAKERNRRRDVLDDDADIVQPLNRHPASLGTRDRPADAHGAVRVTSSGRVRRAGAGTRTPSDGARGRPAPAAAGANLAAPAFRSAAV